METLNLAISPCPNDTFIFGALINGWVPAPSPFVVHYADIEALNEWACQGVMDVCKVSIRALLDLKEYQLLQAGAALGFGCGPLIVAQPNGGSPNWVKGPIAVPGKRTTAGLLLHKWLVHHEKLDGDDVEKGWVYTRFDHILPGVQNGTFKAGLIIHESRFTYPQFGLRKVVDLGEWWERETGLPIPLGGIVARKSLDTQLMLAWEQAIVESLRFAWANPEKLQPFMREHATEMADSVMKKHVELYVNAFSEALGQAGNRAIQVLLNRSNP